MPSRIFLISVGGKKLPPFTHQKQTVTPCVMYRQTFWINLSGT